MCRLLRVLSFQSSLKRCPWLVSHMSLRPSHIIVFVFILVFNRFGICSYIIFITTLLYFYIIYRYNFMLLKSLVLFSSRWIASCPSPTDSNYYCLWYRLPSHMLESKRLFGSADLFYCSSRNATLSTHTAFHTTRQILL